MTAILALDVSTGVWLQYAVMSAISHLGTALPIFVGAFALLYVCVGWLWGLLWNRAWSLGSFPLRWSMVAVAALIASGSLAAVDSLYGNNLFNAQAAREIRAMDVTEPRDIKTADKLVDEIPFAKPIVDGVLQLKHITEDSDDGISLNSQFVTAYNNTITLMWALFSTCILLLLVGVAYAAAEDVKMVSPFVEKK